jgi:hypothetical protein
MSSEFWFTWSAAAARHAAAREARSARGLVRGCALYALCALYTSYVLCGRARTVYWRVQLVRGEGRGVST